jgi:hypothetical protein
MILWDSLHPKKTNKGPLSTTELHKKDDKRGGEGNHLTYLNFLLVWLSNRDNHGDG